MNRFTNVVAMVAVAGVMAGGAVFAADGTTHRARSAKKADAPAPDLVQMTLTGKVAKVETKVGEKTRETYELVTDAGAKLHLPHAWPAATNPETLVGQQVVMIVQGFTQKDSGKTVVKEIKSVEKAPAAVAAPAVAPAPAPGAAAPKAK